MRPARPTSATATAPEPTLSRTRSTGHVKHSTKLLDEVSLPDWRALSVVLNDRAAIYAEEFPAVLADVGPAMVEAFTHEEAQACCSPSPGRGQHSDETPRIHRLGSCT